MIYLVMASKPWQETQRINVVGVSAASALARGFREAGFAVTVLKPLERA